MPAAARLRTEPGTAITSIERSIAACAVISDPPRSRLSTTTSTSLSAARMRLRNGKRKASGAVPGGHSESNTPRPQTASHSSACWRGYGVSGPLPTTATGRPPSTARTPRWAAPSMPFAKPDTTLTPASARPRPSIAAISRPTPVALRVPTMPARRACRAVRSPRTNSAAGGCGSWRSGGGNSGSRRVTTRMPVVAQRSAHSPGRRRSAEARQADRIVAVRRWATAGAGRASPAATAKASTGSWWTSSMRSRATVIRSKPASAATWPSTAGGAVSTGTITPPVRPSPPAAELASTVPSRRVRCRRHLAVDDQAHRRRGRPRDRRSCGRPDGSGGSPVPSGARPRSRRAAAPSPATSPRRTGRAAHRASRR